MDVRAAIANARNCVARHPGASVEHVQDTEKRRVGWRVSWEGGSESFLVRLGPILRGPAIARTSGGRELIAQRIQDGLGIRDGKPLKRG